MVLFLVDFDQQAFRRCVRCTVPYSLILCLFSCATDSQPAVGSEPILLADAPVTEPAPPATSLDSECVGPRDLDISSVKIDTVSGGLLTNGHFESVNYQVTFSDGQRHQLNCLTEVNCSNPTNLGLGQDGCLKKNGCCDKGLIVEKVLPDSAPCPDGAKLKITERHNSYLRYTNQEMLILYELDDHRTHKVSCAMDKADCTAGSGDTWSSSVSRTGGCIHLSQCCDRGIPTDSEAARLEFQIFE